MNAKRWSISGLVLLATAGMVWAGNRAARPHMAAGQPEMAWASFEPPAGAADDDDADGAAKTPPRRKLTAAEINRIRYCELRGMRITEESGRPDAVQVKIFPETIDQFLTDMKDTQGFQNDKERRDFRKLTPPQKLHLMARNDKDLRYADKVQIESDPEIFTQFRKQVMPVVLRGCATAGCHTSASTDETIGFRLFKDPKKLPATTYTNFVVLSQFNYGKYHLIDRATPEESLLLTYMLPTKDVKAELQHPGGVKYKPIFPSRAAAGFKNIDSWIRSLKHPAEDYGVNLIESRAASKPAEKEEPTSRPAEKPMKK